MNSILQPLDGVSIEAMGGVKDQVEQNLIAPCAVGVIAELRPRADIAQKLNVDLVPGRAAVVGSGVGKEGRNDPRHRRRSTSTILGMKTASPSLIRQISV